MHTKDAIRTESTLTVDGATTLTGAVTATAGVTGPVAGAVTGSTGTFSGSLTASGDLIKASAANGYKATRTCINEVVVIAAAATSVSVAAIPAGATVHAVSCRVTTVIPTATTFDVGLNGGDADAFCNDVSVAATSTAAGNLTCPLYVAAETLVLITPNGTPANNTGRVRLILDYTVFTPPTS